MSNSGKKATDDDDVEQLLRAAQEDVLLKLSVNSHMARGSAAAIIDSDLDRRFQALKKPQKLPKRDDSPKTAPKKASIPPADDGDLYARFAALKTSLPSNSSSSAGDGSKIDQKATDEAEEEAEDEVEKVIQWAIDAARLDPSPPSDDDDDNDERRSNETESDDDDDDDDDGVDRRKKNKRK